VVISVPPSPDSTPAARVLRTVPKPAGIPVFPPHGEPAGDCLLARLLADEPERGTVAWPEGFAGGILHRLDTSTSGAVAVADDPHDLEALRGLFREHRLVKRYRLLSARDPGWDENAVEAPIAHDPRHKGRMVVQRGRHTPHRGSWLPACTAFRRLEGRLFEAEMRTGVMHQIRVHAAFLGIPILGDRRYGGGVTPDDAPDGVTFFLHHVGLSMPGLRTASVPDPPWVLAPWTSPPLTDPRDRPTPARDR
jgi:23S rRNA pseudouridine1911/1915/1917 synthase